MCLMAPLPQRLSRFVRELRSPALVSCWPTQWPRSHITSCCGTRTQHCCHGALPRRASILQMSSVSCSCIRLHLHLRVHHLLRCSLRPATGTSRTTLDACSRYRPIRCRRVRSARVAFPTAQTHSLHASAMSGRSATRYTSLADALWWACCRSGSSSLWSSGYVRLGSTWARLWTRRLKSKLCHCQVCVFWFSFPRPQSRCTSHSGSTLSLLCRVLWCASYSALPSFPAASMQNGDVTWTSISSSKSSTPSLGMHASILAPFFGSMAGWSTRTSVSAHGPVRRAMLASSSLNA